MTDAEQSILELARKRFERFGFRKTTVDEICRDGGISKKTLYRHFRDKEDLFARVLIQEALSARAEVFRRLGEVPDPPEKLERLIRIAVEFFQEERFITRLLRDEEGIYLPSSLSSYVERAESATIRMIAEILRDGIDQGRFREVDPRVTSYALLKLFQAFTYARSPSLPRVKRKEKQEVQILVDFVLHALGKASKAPTACGSSSDRPDEW
jgi:AcrR family transcriptional regulator